MAGGSPLCVTFCTPAPPPSQPVVTEGARDFDESLEQQLLYSPSLPLTSVTEKKEEENKRKEKERKNLKTP